MRAELPCSETRAVVRGQMLVQCHVAWLAILLCVSPLSAQKVGDSLIVVAESEAELKMDSRTIGTISRGEPVTVEAVGDAGFRVACGNGGGWIAKRDVMAIDEAIRYFTRAIASKPRAVDYFARGNAWCKKNEYDKAIADCSEAIRLEAKSRRAFSLRGFAYMAKGYASGASDFYAKGIADYTEAIRLAPNDGGVWYDRGDAYLRTGDFDKAMADLTEAIRLDSKCTRAYAARGSVYTLKGDFDKAIADYSEALRLDPKDAWTYSNRGAAYIQKGNVDRAIADFTEAIRNDPKCTQAYNNRGEAWRRRGDFDKAIADYTEAIKLDPKDPVAPFGRGRTWLSKEEYDKAIADYTEAIRKDPKYVDAYFRRGDTWCWSGDYDRAVTDYTEALRLDPTHVKAYARRVWAEKRKSDLAKIAGNSNSAAAARAKSPCDYEFRAMLSIELGNYDRGIADLRTAIRLNPKDRAATFEAWPKTPVVAHALRHGQRQVAQMLKDRPALAEHGKAAEPLYQWAARKFAGEDLGEEVFWDSADPPVPFGGVNYKPTDEMPGYIEVRETYSDKANLGRKLSFEETWNTVVFELYNIANASDFEKRDRQASEGKVSKAQYAVKTIEIECRAAEKTRSFYIHVFLPWARQHHIATDPSTWHVGVRSDPAENLIQCININRKDPFWRAYRQDIEAGYDSVVAAAKAEKERKSVDEAPRQALPKQGVSANDGSRVVVFPEESRTRNQRSAASRHIDLLDVLTVWVRGAIPHQPIQRRLLVEPSGSVNLGPLYGRVKVKGLTLDEAETAIKKHLEMTLRAVDVEVLAAGRATQWAGETPRSPYHVRPKDVLRILAVGVAYDEPIADDFCVDANGTIFLGKTYGSVTVKGLTIEEAEKAITEHLRTTFDRAEVSITLAGWKSDRRRCGSK